MPTKRRFEIAELFPQPKIIELGEGISELATDVRLATINVWPIQRKALRSILTLAGVRVVANKKKYVVTATVRDPAEDPKAFDLRKVPEALRHDYYELRIQDSEVFIDAPYQEGMVWAAQTLGLLFKMMFNGLAVPNLTIRDWPSLPMRGVKMDACCATDRMDLNAWKQAIDIYSTFKLNLLGVGIYDCLPGTRLPEADKPGEFLFPTVSDPPSNNDPHSETRYRYFNVKYDRWYDKTEASLMFQEDFFGDVVTYAKERGMVVFPVFNILGANTLLPRLIPAISARNAKGKPTGAGLCMAGGAARDALAKYLEAFMEKYFPDGVEYFHIGTLASLKDESPCQCAKCKATARPKLLAEYLEFLVECLTAHGVGKVIMGANLLFPKTGFAASALGLLLKKAALKGKLVIDWCVTVGGQPCEAPKVADAAKQKLESWAGPVGSASIQELYHDSRKELDAGIAAAVKDKLSCVLANVQYDPIFLDHYALLGVRGWENTDPKLDTTDALRERWASLNWYAYAEDVDKELDALDRLCANPVYQLCLPSRYIGGAGKPKPYPAAALEALAKDKKATDVLQDVSREAGDLMAAISRRLERVAWAEPLKTALQSMLGCAQRLQIDADVFGLMLEARRLAAAKTPAAKLQKALADGVTRLTGQLQVIEGSMPDCLLWLTMQQLGCYKLFLERLIGALKAKTAPAKLCWEIPMNWEVPEDK